MRGQAHTLEAFTAALLMTGAIIFTLQATAVTPLSASTSNQHLQNQQEHIANDLLRVAAENGSLEEAVLYWNTTSEGFEGTGELGYYTDGGPPNEFGALLNGTFRDDRIAVNVDVHYWSDDRIRRVRMVNMGTPSENAVVASRSLTVYNQTVLTGPDPVTVEEAYVEGGFYAPDHAPGTQLFNVLEVRITVWRM